VLPAAAPEPAAGAAPEPRTRVDLVVVAVSTGGPQTLPLLLDGARPFGAPVVVAQHMPERFTHSLAALLRSETGVPVVEGEHRMRLAPGEVVIVPGGRDAAVVAAAAGYELRLTMSDAAVHPSADLLFETAAMAGRHPGGVILTGMGSDGVRGAAALRRRRLPVLVQDPASCVVDGMPRAAIEAGVATGILPPREIGETLARWTDVAYPRPQGNAETP
jgi:two-component system chemotaxis response regulator CheB